MEQDILKFAEKTMVANLTISVWGATKADKEVSQDTTKRWSAQDKAGKFRKNLVENAFPRTKSVRDRARAFHKYHTRIWEDETGNRRLLSSGNFIEYISKMKEFEREFEKALMLDVEEWPMNITKAHRTLGDMFKREDYPSSLEVKQKFHFRLDISPVSVTSDFARFMNELGQEAVDSLSTSMEERLKKSYEKAYAEITSQFFNLVKELAGKLEDPGYTPKEGMATSLIKYMTALPAMDFTDNPDLAALRREVESKLLGVSPEVLRSNEGERKKAAAAAQNILDKMGSFWGN
jgi:hypothetical protein